MTVSTVSSGAKDFSIKMSGLTRATFSDIRTMTFHFECSKKAEAVFKQLTEKGVPTEIQFPLPFSPSLKSSVLLKQIPVDSWILIFSQLSYSDLQNVSLVSRRWHQISQDNRLGLKQFHQLISLCLKTVNQHAYSFNLGELCISHGTPYFYVKFPKKLSGSLSFYQASSSLQVEKPYQTRTSYKVDIFEAASEELTAYDFVIKTCIDSGAKSRYEKTHFKYHLSGRYYVDTRFGIIPKAHLTPLQQKIIKEAQKNAKLICDQKMQKIKRAKEDLRTRSEGLVYDNDYFDEPIWAGISNK